MPQSRHRQGALLALLAALLFGAGTPLIKLLFGAADPILFGALISLGSALGVAAVMRVRWHIGPLVTRENRLPFAGSTVIGGALAPVLLVWGISHAPGSAAALLLNLEAPFTILIAWLFFREKVGVRFLAGLGLVTLGGVVVSLHEGSGQGRVLAGLAVAGACLCWAIDNNCTACLKDVVPAQFAIFKGLLAALLLFPFGLARAGSDLGWNLTGEALLVGACSNGIALLVFVMAIQRLGAGRTAAYFATAPFVGAAASVAVLGEPVTPHLLAAAGLMAVGVAVLLSERHTLPERV
jgi:drug/metabolite transporter (DMT)-like permease